MKKVLRLLPILLLLLAACSTPAGRQEEPEPVHSVQTAPVSAEVSPAEASMEEDEPQPLPPEPPPFQEYDVTLMALGDNLMHMGIVYTGKQEDGSMDYSFLFDGVEEYLEIADLKMINQETVLGGNHRGFSGFPYFNSPTEVGDAIAAAGFNIVLQASNHSADQGLDGLIHCAEFWKQYPGILMTGIYTEKRAASSLPHAAENAESSPAEDTEISSPEGAEATSPKDAAGGSKEDPGSIPLITVDGITFAVLNYTYSPNMEVIPEELEGYLELLCGYDPHTNRLDFTTLNPQVLEDIRTAEAAADVVIVCPHWGTEYTTEPSSYQKDWALQMTEAGADVIIGTHPHVVQPVEWVEATNGNRALCYYSLGNYVSTQKEGISMLEAMAWVTFRVTEEGVSILVEHTGAVPLVCHYTAGPVRLEQVYPLEDYTAGDAARHGIRPYGGVNLTLEDLAAWSEEILGGWVLTREQLQSPEPEPDAPRAQTP